MEKLNILEMFAGEFTEDQLNEVVKLWNKGWSLVDIAYVLEVDDYEIVILIMYLEIKKQIKPRENGIFGTINHDEVTYQNNGRMNSNKLLCHSDGYRWTESELEYLCRYVEHDGAQDIALSLGKSQASVYRQLKRMKDKNLFEYYKNLNKHWGA